MVIVDFWRNQNNQKGLTPANGISPNFTSLLKFLSDSNIQQVVRGVVRDRRAYEKPVDAVGVDSAPARFNRQVKMARE